MATPGHVSRVTGRQIIAGVCSVVADCVMVLRSAEDTGEDAAVAPTYTLWIQEAHNR